MADEVDYFNSVDVIPLGKRRISRLEVKRVLKGIARQRRGFEANWSTGKISFMKTYSIYQFPKWFAKKGDKVEIQVSIRPLIGETAENCDIPGLAELEVYYRFKKTLVKIKSKEKSEEKNEEEEKTEQSEFDTGRDIVEFTDWRGSILVNSSIASMFYRLLIAIGINKVKKVLNRLQRKKK